MVTVRYTDKGEAQMESEHLDLPPDVANGIVQTLLKNVHPDAPPASFAYVAATPKPRLVKLQVSVGGRDRFATGRIGRLATHYVLKVDPGPVTGLLAKVTGKQPPDSHVWVLAGDAPAFLRAEQPFLRGPALAESAGRAGVALTRDAQSPGRCGERAARIRPRHQHSQERRDDRSSTRAVGRRAAASRFRRGDRLGATRVEARRRPRPPVACAAPVLQKKDLDERGQKISTCCRAAVRTASCADRWHLPPITRRSRRRC